MPTRSTEGGRQRRAKWRRPRPLRRFQLPRCASICASPPTWPSGWTAPLQTPPSKPAQARTRSSSPGEANPCGRGGSMCQRVAPAWKCRRQSLPHARCRISVAAGRQGLPSMHPPSVATDGSRPRPASAPARSASQRAKPAFVRPSRTGHHPPLSRPPRSLPNRPASRMVEVGSHGRWRGWAPERRPGSSPFWSRCSSPRPPRPDS
jgi:hypothetical protein